MNLRRVFAALMPLGDAVGDTPEADEPRNMEDSKLCAGGEKGLPLRAKSDKRSGGHVGGGSPTSGPGLPLMAMETTSPRRRRGFSHLRAWLAAHGIGGGVFLAAAGELAGRARIIF
jgi:hypothetical protein